jgi:hypothetical protein
MQWRDTYVYIVPDLVCEATLLRPSAVKIPDSCEYRLLYRVLTAPICDPCYEIQMELVTPSYSTETGNIFRQLAHLEVEIYRLLVFQSGSYEEPRFLRYSTV